MTTINAKQFGEICDGVWNDRETVLEGTSRESGEAALLRAVFWRLRKAGIETAGSPENDDSKPTMRAYHSMVGRLLEAHGRPAFDSTSFLKHLVERYQKEIRRGKHESSGS